MRWPVTSRPRSSRRVNALRSGRSKIVLGMSRSFGWTVSEPPSSEDLDPYPATTRPTPPNTPTPSIMKSPITGHDTRSEEVHCLQIGCAPNHKNKRGICETTTDTTRGPLHPLRGAAPVTRHCTRYGARHPIRRGALPTDRVQCPQSQEQTRNLRDDGRHNARAAAPVMSRCTRYGARHPLRSATPVTERDTRSEEVHCLRIGCAPNHKNKRGICETITDTHQAPGARSV